MTVSIQASVFPLIKLSSKERESQKVPGAGGGALCHRERLAETSR